MGGGWISSTASKTILLLSILFYVNSVISAIVYRKFLYTTENYPFIANTSLNLLPIPCFALLAFWAYKNGHITSQMRTSIPLHKLIEIGVYCALQNWAGTYGANWVTGSLGSLLGKSRIPFTMILSIVLLRARFRPFHYIGAFTVLSGILVAILPPILERHNSSTSDGASSSIAGIVLYLLSTFFLSLQYIRIEQLFQKHACNVYYLQFHVCLWNFILGLLLWPLDILLLPETPQDMLLNAWQGLKCFAGHNSQLGDDCATNAILAVSFVVLYVIGMSASTLLVEKASANLVTLLSATALPLINLLFCSHFIMGDKASPWSIYLIFALVLVLIGMSIYRYVPDASLSTKKEQPGFLERSLVDDNEYTELLDR